MQKENTSNLEIFSNNNLNKLALKNFEAKFEKANID
jgi:hypothetical protein